MSTLQNSPSGFFKRFRLGNLYLKTFPMEKKLTPIFPELRMIKATRFGIRYMPPIAIFTLTWQIALGRPRSCGCNSTICLQFTDAGFVVAW